MRVAKDNNASLSRFERYVAVMKALAFQGALDLADIGNKGGLDLAWLSDHVSFLLEMGMLRESVVGEKVVYSITDKGLRALAFFNELYEVP